LLDRQLREYNNRYNKPFHLDRNSWKYGVIDGLYYPIPNDDFVSDSKKHSALQKVLISIFRRYHPDIETWIWAGYIPTDLANKMIAEGHYFSEVSLGVALLHGKLAHMLHRLILYLAVEFGEIPMSYLE
jgi:hypothetical protein